MATLRERIMSGLAWLAVLLTPLNGVPHFVCRCPNGYVKPFCLGSASKGTGCCCGCACCRRASEGKCCCCHTGGASSVQRPSTEPSPNSHCSAGRPGCSKTLAQQDALAPKAGKQIAWDFPFGEAHLPASCVLPNPLTQGERGRSSLHLHSPAPPTDLIALLGRLLI